MTYQDRVNRLAKKILSSGFDPKYHVIRGQPVSWSVFDPAVIPDPEIQPHMQHIINLGTGLLQRIGVDRYLPLIWRWCQENPGGGPNLAAAMRFVLFPHTPETLARKLAEEILVWQTNEGNFEYE